MGGSVDRLIDRSTTIIKKQLIPYNRTEHKSEVCPCFIGLGSFLVVKNKSLNEVGTTIILVSESIYNP